VTNLTQHRQRRSKEPPAKARSYGLMKHKRIQQVTAELANGAKLVEEKKAAVKHAKGRIAKSNQKRELKVMKKCVEALQDQKQIIEQGGQIPVE
jgi:hypothetical protein